jgi:hypothetical protein
MATGKFVQMPALGWQSRSAHGRAASALPFEANLEYDFCESL